MERISQKQDDLLLQLLDGTLTERNKNELESLLLKDLSLKARLEELRMVHSVLARKAKLEQPSKVFTDRVMSNLDQLPIRSTMSPRNGLLLLCGVLVAVGIMTLLLSVGVFDNMNSPIALDNLPVKNDFIKNPIAHHTFQRQMVDQWNSNCRDGTFVRPVGSNYFKALL